MSKPVLIARSALFASVYSDHALAENGGNCPVTLGTDEFLGPPFPESENWCGSEGRAVMVPGNRAWGTTGPNALIAVKLFWWSAGFKPGMESNLKVYIRNLDGKPNDAVVSDPTNAHAESLGGWTMLTGIDFPSAGCWEISGAYLGQALTFVIETVDRSESGEDSTHHHQITKRPPSGIGLRAIFRMLTRMAIPNEMIAAFLDKHRLPETFARTETAFYVPLGLWVEQRLSDREGSEPFVLGISGAQGTGKSTLADFIREYLTVVHDRFTVVLSIVDLYLTRAQRQALAKNVHPLLGTRGMPGTHDVDLGLTVIGSLKRLK